MNKRTPIIPVNPAERLVIEMLFFLAALHYLLRATINTTKMPQINETGQQKKEARAGLVKRSRGAEVRGRGAEEQGSRGDDFSPIFQAAVVVAH